MSGSKICVSIKSAASFIDEATGPGEFLYKSEASLWRHVGSILPCPARPCPALPCPALLCPGTQSLVKSDLWGQRTAEKCFYSDHSPSLVGGKEFPALACMQIHKQNHINNPFQQHITLRRSTPFMIHNSRTIHIPIASLLLLPITIWRMNIVRWSSPPWHWGRRVIFRQLCLKQWNQTEAPHS